MLTQRLNVINHLPVQILSRGTPIPTSSIPQTTGLHIPMDLSRGMKIPTRSATNDRTTQSTRHNDGCS
eukprot:14800936-Heterocapsa_arctica.AAC.1